MFWRCCAIETRGIEVGNGNRSMENGSMRDEMVCGEYGK